MITEAFVVVAAMEMVAVVVVVAAIVVVVVFIVVAVVRIVEVAVGLLTGWPARRKVGQDASLAGLLLYPSPASGDIDLFPCLMPLLQ